MHLSMYPSTYVCVYVCVCVCVCVCVHLRRQSSHFFRSFAYVLP